MQVLDKLHFILCKGESLNERDTYSAYLEAEGCQIREVKEVLSLDIFLDKQSAC
jgi:hypothetical protein